MLEEHNVKFYMNDRVTEIRGENGKVTIFTLTETEIVPPLTSVFYR